MSITQESVKKKTRNVQSKLKEFGHKVALGQCQELVAISMGYKNSHVLASQYENSSLTDALDVILKRRMRFAIGLGCSTVNDDYLVPCAIVELSEKDIRKLEQLSANPMLAEMESFNISLPDSIVEYAEVIDGDYGFFDEIDCALSLNDKNQAAFGPENITVKKTDYNDKSMASTNIVFKIQKGNEITIAIEYFGNKKYNIMYTGSFSLNEITFKNIQWL